MYDFFMRICDLMFVLFCGAVVCFIGAGYVYCFMRGPGFMSVLTAIFLFVIAVVFGFFRYVNDDLFT